jgi:HTH-type transcriptional regulator, competence development regulator
MKSARVSRSSSSAGIWNNIYWVDTQLQIFYRCALVMAMTFGERLRQLRLERRMNQRTLAAHVGINFTYLSKIENERMEPPSAETIVKLAQALGANPDELLLLAHKVPQDLTPVITQSPQWPAFLRSIRDLTDAELRELSAHAQELRTRRVKKMGRKGRRMQQLPDIKEDAS